jgi:type IV fimbrial biogenesis protein FimT
MNVVSQRDQPVAVRRHAMRGTHCQLNPRSDIDGVTTGLAGFTLVELIAVIGVVAVLAAIAVPSFNAFTAQQRVKTVSSDLYLAMSKARSEAVKRNGNIVIQPLDSGLGWQGGWGLWDPVNNVYLDKRSAATGTTIATGAGTITYQASGRVLGGAPVQFQVSSSGSTAMARCLQLDPSGRPYLKGAAC